MIGKLIGLLVIIWISFVNYTAFSKRNWHVSQVERLENEGFSLKKLGGTDLLAPWTFFYPNVWQLNYWRLLEPKGPIGFGGEIYQVSGKIVRKEYIYSLDCDKKQVRYLPANIVRTREDMFRLFPNAKTIGIADFKKRSGPLFRNGSRLYSLSCRE